MKLSIFGPTSLISATLIATAIGATPTMPTIDKRADGSLAVTNANGQGQTMFSPPSHICTLISGGAASFENDSSDTAFLYAGDACSGDYDIVGVGGVWNSAGVAAGSFRLGSAL